MSETTAAAAEAQPPVKKARLEDEAPAPATQEQRIAEWNDQTCNINKAVMVDAETKSFHELIDMPVHTLQGLPFSKEEALDALGINTIRDLAEYKFTVWAQAIVTLAEYEDEGKRKEGSTMNIGAMVVRDFEKKSLKEITAAPVSALEGISKEAAAFLIKFKIKTVSDLANWHFIKVAKAMVTMASLEHDETAAERRQESLLKRLE